MDFEDPGVKLGLVIIMLAACLKGYQEVIRDSLA